MARSSSVSGSHGHTQCLVDHHRATRSPGDAWTANSGDDTVSKIAAATGVVAATITVGNNPFGVAFDGTHMWVANGSDDTVSKIPVG
jgi:YVTN family beta-propeller protein